jgi:hypothetical protein
LISISDSSIVTTKNKWHKDAITFSKESTAEKHIEKYQKFNSSKLLTFGVEPVLRTVEIEIPKHIQRQSESENSDKYLQSNIARIDKAIALCYSFPNIKVDKESESNKAFDKFGIYCNNLQDLYQFHASAYFHGIHFKHMTITLNTARDTKSLGKFAIFLT